MDGETLALDDLKARAIVSSKDHNNNNNDKEIRKFFSTQHTFTQSLVCDASKVLVNRSNIET